MLMMVDVVDPRPWRKMPMKSRLSHHWRSNTNSQKAVVLFSDGHLLSKGGGDCLRCCKPASNDAAGSEEVAWRLHHQRNTTPA